MTCMHCFKEDSCEFKDEISINTVCMAHSRLYGWTKIPDPHLDFEHFVPLQKGNYHDLSEDCQCEPRFFEDETKLVHYPFFRG